MTTFLAFNCKDGLVLHVDSGGNQSPQSVTSNQWTYTTNNNKLWDFQLNHKFSVLQSGELYFPDNPRSKTETFAREFEMTMMGRTFHNNLEFANALQKSFLTKWNSLSANRYSIPDGVIFWVGSSLRHEGSVVSQLKFIPQPNTDALAPSSIQRIEMVNHWRSQYMIDSDYQTIMSELLNPNTIKFETRLRKLRFDLQKYRNYKQIASKVKNTHLTLEQALDLGHALMLVLIQYFEEMQPLGSGPRFAGGSPISTQILTK